MFIKKLDKTYLTNVRKKELLKWLFGTLQKELSRMIYANENAIGDRSCPYCGKIMTRFRSTRIDRPVTRDVTHRCEKCGKSYLVKPTDWSEDAWTERRIKLEQYALDNPDAVIDGTKWIAAGTPRWKYLTGFPGAPPFLVDVQYFEGKPRKEIYVNCSNCGEKTKKRLFREENGKTKYLCDDCFMYGAKNLL